MKKVDLVIIGGGPAGLSSAIQAGKHHVQTLLIERGNELGGQLVKQTHKFFGSKKQYASVRGFDIAKKLISELERYKDYVAVYTNTTVVGLYPDKVLTALCEDNYFKIQAEKIILATGASEKFLAFQNNDLPGIYGAGAVQTLMNQYGVLPGKKVLMVGSGNIGLIVSYQLIQAGADVVGIIEASPHIGGYAVHASKIRRLGIPIYTKRTVKRAIGKKSIQQVITIGLDDKWQDVPNTELVFDCDTLCISVGLSPMHQLLSMDEVQMKYIKELGGNVPVLNKHHETNISGVYACGDASGVEEASSAMVEGSLTGIYASLALDYRLETDEEVLKDYHAQLRALRNGPFGAKTQKGLEKLRGEQNA